MKNEAGLRLTGIRIVVRVPELDVKTSGGIVIPEMVHAKEERAQMTGVLIDGAPDAWECKELKGVKKGETVFFARYSGSGCEFHVKKVMYKVMNATDVIGVMEAEMDSQFRAAHTTVEAYGVEDAVGAA